MASMKHTVGNRISGVWRSLRQSRDQRASDRRNTAALLESVEYVVDGTEPGIRMVSGYRRKIQGAIRISLDYANTLVNNIPGAMEVSRRTFHSDPHVNAFFTNVDELQTIFSHSSELRDIVGDYRNRTATEICALLCMQKTEKAVLGMELSGNIIKREVQQTAVSFSDHRIYSPAATEPETRRCLKQCFFDGLVTTALGCIVHLRLSRHNLETRRYKLRAKLRRYESSIGTQKIGQRSVADHPSYVETIRAELGRIDEAIQKTQTVAPRDCLEEVAAVFRHPENYVRLVKTSMRLDKMGIRISTSSKETGNNIDIAEVLIGEDAPRVVMLAKFPKDELRPGTDFLEQAHRHLHH